MLKCLKGKEFWGNIYYFWGCPVKFWMDNLKASIFQNEFMNSSFLPKYDQKIVRISALHTTGQKSWQFFVHIFGETMTSKFILKFTDL